MKHKIVSLNKFKALDAEQGIFEAIVAVFGNIDRGGDKIMPGAFAATLDDWQKRDRPIPVVFAHEWDNLDAHIGEVLEAKEVEEGLYVKAQLDMEESFAQRVFKRLKKRTLAEFSFSYEIIKDVVKDGVRELHALELLEVGPCLVGMNPDTRLLSAKAGARHTAKEFETIQAIHDLAVELGAKCAGLDDSGDGEGEGAGQGEAGNGKLRTPGASTLAARLAMELLEM